VENLAEDVDDDFYDFLVVSYKMKIMFYIHCYPNETTRVMNFDADANFLLFNCDLSIYNAR